MIRTVVLLGLISMSFLIVGCEITTYRCPDDDWAWDDSDDWDENDDGDESADLDCYHGDEDCPEFDQDGEGDDGDASPPVDIPEEVIWEPSPCPDGDCGCSEDKDCDEGLLCIDARCVDPLMVCVFDVECGTAAVCINNECHSTCDCEAQDCPIGQDCVDGICLDRELPGPDGCVIAEDCGEPDEFQCINATCHSTCSEPEICTGTGEICIAGVCRADTAPLRECTSDEDCDFDLACHRGLCRLPCVADINCQEPLGVCGEAGICLNVSELEPSCSRGSDCGEGEDCLDGQCE